MAENKTKATKASVEDYITSRANEGQKADCKTRMALLEKFTEDEPKMWGSSIVVHLDCEGAEQKKFRSKLGKYGQ